MSKLRQIIHLRNYSRAHPIDRTVNALKFSFPSLGKKSNENVIYPEHADVVIVGGGVMGSSVAYWLKERTGRGLNTIVFEKDPTYAQASTVLSVGGLRQQFSIPENVQMSQYGAEFIRNIKKHLGEDVDVQFTPHGYLVLVNEDSSEELERNVVMQRSFGVKNELLSPSMLKERYPWLNTDGIQLGCIGLESEGWMDPWALLNGFRRKAIQLGATYVRGNVVDFESEAQQDVLMEGVPFGKYQRLNKVIYETDDGEKRECKFSICVLCAGARSGELAKRAQIGVGDGLLSIPLPIEPRKRNVFCFSTQGENPPGARTPMVMDPKGLWFRREGLGGNYIAGLAPPQHADGVDTSTELKVDHEYFDSAMWPILANRVPAFESVKVNSAWAGWYDYNAYDENAIIGPHPYYNNFYIAAGFSGHGLQHSPATGRAISEMILDGRFTTIDLTRLGFDRILTDRPLLESNIY